MDSFRTCPSCGRKLALKLATCPYCHVRQDGTVHDPSTAATPEARRCPNCEASLEPGSIGCATCGHGKPETPSGGARLAKLPVLLTAIAAAIVLVIVFSVRKYGAVKEQDRVVSAGGKTDDGQLLERVYAAFQASDLSAYQKVSVTPAEFLALQQVDELAQQHERATGRKPNIVGRKMMAGQTFAGSVLVPEQRRLQEDDFKKVVAGGPGIIDFKQMRFKGVGTLVTTDKITQPEGEPIPVRVYSVRVEGPQGERDTRDLAPLFVVADYQGDPMLIGLRMP